MWNKHPVVRQEKLTRDMRMEKGAKKIYAAFHSADKYDENNPRHVKEVTGEERTEE